MYMDLSRQGETSPGATQVTVHGGHNGVLTT